MEDVRRCKKRGRRGLSRTSAKNGLAKTVALRAVCAGVGFGAIRAGGFLPVKGAGGCKAVAGAYFGGRGACIQYDPKVILGAKFLDLKGDAYSGS